MLVGYLAVNAAIAAVGALVTAPNITGWYAAAEKPSATPPDWLFAPVWAVLYLLLAVAAWLIWRAHGHHARRHALDAYAVQLALTAFWPPVFFGMYPVLGPVALWFALALLLLLDAAVLVLLVRARRVRWLAAWLVAPYWLWLLYATMLNAAMAALAR